MSLDDTVMSFRVRLSVLFSGRIPQDLFVDDRNGTTLKLQDRVSLREYGLLCFQLVTATFSSDVAPAFPELGGGRAACRFLRRRIHQMIILPVFRFLF